MKRNVLKAILITALAAVIPLQTAQATDKRQNGATTTPETPGQLRAQTKPKTPGLLLPAVQAAPEAAPRAAARPTGLRATSSDGQASDTSCDGVNACNDMIATCLSLGGNVTPTEYDPQTGAPSGATCYAPGS